MNADSLQADPSRPSIPRAELPPGPSEMLVIGQAFRLRNDLIGLLEEAATSGKAEISPRITIKVKDGLPATLERRCW